MEEDFTEKIAKTSSKPKSDSEIPVFKTPVIIGKRPGGRKVTNSNNQDSNKSSSEPTVDSVAGESPESDIKENVTEVIDSKKELVVEKTQALKSTIADKPHSIPYKEPTWSGHCSEQYNVEIIKNGVVLTHLDVTTKPYFVLGRLSNCDLVLEHPSISRYHSVLQYRSIADEKQEKGWYLYDLGSTHGTFLNKQQLPPRVFCRIQCGHVFKFGVSSRMFILQGPEEDQEAESNLTVTELIAMKKKQSSLLNEFEDDQGKKKQSTTEPTSSVVDAGVSWGMAEDAEDENPMAENPFAILGDASCNEELYLDDPKKSLRGWFEREGYELEYMVEEKNCAHFVCRVELPIEFNGRSSVTAEAIVKGGKKKEAVVQCALEACRILDRHGLLRQANHQSKVKKKKKNYDEDYYSSDEDTFLDRTGAVERKRQAKLKAAGKISDSVETYDSLMEKYTEIEDEISHVQKEIAAGSAYDSLSKMKNDDVDDIDDYIAALQAKETSSHKSVPKLKAQLHQLQREENRLRTLINVARPAIIPELKSSLIIETKIENELTKDSQDPQVSKDSKAEEAVKETHSLKKEESSKKAVKETAQVPKEKRSSERAAIGPLLSSGLIKQLKEEEHQQEQKKEKEETKLEHAEKMEDQDEAGLAEKSGLVIRKRKKANKPAVIKRGKEEPKVEYNTSDTTKYAMWVPPQDQSGDGKTSLNKKLGY